MQPEDLNQEKFEPKERLVLAVSAMVVEIQ